MRIPILFCALTVMTTLGCDVTIVDPIGPVGPVGEEGYLLAFAAEDWNDPSLPLVYTATWSGEYANFVAVGTGPAWSPAGDEILFLDAGVHAFDLETEHVETLREAGGYRLPLSLSWSPFGQDYAYLEYHGGACSAIYAASRYSNVDVDYGDFCSSNGALDWRLHWSPSGDELLYHSREPGRDHYDIFVAEIGGSLTWQLTESAWNDHSPSWSPDGNNIVYISDRHAWDGELHIMDWQGMAVGRVSSGTAAFPTWSPDGNWIAFFRPAAGLYIIRPDGTDERRLTGRGSGLADFPAAPQWSPDGEWIAYLSDSNHLYSIHASGSDNTQVFETRLVDGVFSWSPRRYRID